MESKYITLLSWLLVTTHFITNSVVCNNIVPAVIIFGDSTVDTGNNNRIATVLKSNFRPYGRDFEGGRPTGRFSNGRLLSDFIVEQFGIKPYLPAYLDPAYSIEDFATGVCFASAGAGYDNATSHLVNAIPLWKEVEYYKEYQAKLRDYLGVEKANQVLSEALYFTSLGSNDFLENYFVFPTRRLQFSVEQYQDFLVDIAHNFILELYKLGVRKLSLTGTFPLGCIPLERALNIIGHHECIDMMNDVALGFNRKLENMMNKLSKELPTLKLVYANLYDVVYDIVTRPSSYGIEVVEKACCPTTTVCSVKNPFTCKDANKFAFWDGLHPTENTYKIMSDNLLSQLSAAF